jgi:flagellar FliL protein
MAAKADPPAAPAKEAPAPVASAPAASGGGIKAWIPVVVALLLAPAATWGTVEFVLLPRLQKKIAALPAGGAAPAAAEAPAQPPKSGGKEGKGGAAPGSTYEFQNIVVNLAGTMGTRYLKTSFLVTGTGGADVKAAFDGSKPRLTDVTLNVLSSLSLADLEEPGAKNIIREKLVSAYNQALGKKVADQVYFSDFVIQ